MTERDDPERVLRVHLSVRECAVISLALTYKALLSSGVPPDQLPPLPPSDLFAMRDIVRKLEREVLRR